MKDKKDFLGTFRTNFKKEKNQSEINSSLSSEDIEESSILAEDSEISEENENLNNIDIQENSKKDEEEFNSSNEIMDEERTNYEEEKPSNKKEYIEIEDALKDEDSLMDSLLADADELLSTTDLKDNTSKEENLEDLGTTLDEALNEEKEEIFEEDLPENNSLEGTEDFGITNENTGTESLEDENPYEEEILDEKDSGTSPEFIYSEEDLDIDESKYYNDAEIAAKRNKISGKSTLLKVIVGICALSIIAGLAFTARYLLNNKDDLFNKKQEVETENNKTQTPTPTIIPTEKPTDIPSNEINNSNGLEVENEIKTETDLNNEKEDKEEVSSFIQTFTGYVVDINNSDIYVSDKLSAEQISELEQDFNSFLEGTDTTVYIKDVDETTTNTNESSENNGIVVIGAPSNETSSDETESDTNSQEKIYHAYQVCEFTGNTDLIPVKLSNLSSEYTVCSECGTDIELSNNNVLDYDYSTVPNLASIIYKKFNVDAETIPSWVTIGSQVTISYIQNEETYLNDIIEISRAKSTSSSSEFTQVENGLNSSNSNENEDDYRISDTNIFGSEFDAIVATINDRKKNSNKNTGNVLDDELSIAVPGTRESVSSKISIGTCEYVWIQIVWKKNAETKSIPDIDDVTVELQTPSGSLVNDSNINSYGKKWINKRVINYVLKNPKAGNWTVLFTKDVGTYLGDVTIQAAPMTGFLQIKKAAAKYTEGTLKCIWQATGIADDNCIVQIYARNGNNDILLYSGNTIDDDIRTVDMVDIDTAKIAGNIYDIVMKITDIDVSASEPKKITYKFITDEYIIENIEIPKRN